MTIEQIPPPQKSLSELTEQAGNSLLEFHRDSVMGFYRLGRKHGRVDVIQIVLAMICFFGAIICISHYF